MDIKTLCLGLLSLNEACGYDLKKKFESLFKHFFAAGYGSIYPALADLAEAGLVDCREVPQNGRPARKVYSITESGRKHFQDALNSANPTHKLRSDFLVMMYFADQLDNDRLQLLLNSRVSAFGGVTAHIKNITDSWPSDSPAGARFVAGFGEAMAKAATQYIEENRHILKGHSQDQAKGQPRIRHTDLSQANHQPAATIEERV